MTENRAASIRARLKQHATASKQDFNLTLTQYGLERLLYRLSISEHAPNFLLKGALLFQLWYGESHRPTRDADLLGFGPDDVPTLIGVFRSVCGIAVHDGIVFEQKSVEGTEIRKEPEHGSQNHERFLDLALGNDLQAMLAELDVHLGRGLATIQYAAESQPDVMTSVEVRLAAA
jgi:hypothetical protein